MNSFVGTSGYQYPAWRGTFCPEKLANGKDVVVLRGSVPYQRKKRALVKFYSVVFAQGVCSKALTYDFFRLV
jgi:hypothetical protein